MELHKMVEVVENREDLIKFVNQLRMDLQNNKGEWANITLEDYLEAMETWINDMDGYYLNNNKILPKQPSWRNIAEILIASSMYE